MSCLRDAVYPPRGGGTTRTPHRPARVVPIPRRDRGSPCTSGAPMLWTASSESTHPLAPWMDPPMLRLRSLLGGLVLPGILTVCARAADGPAAVIQPPALTI